jgi:predicted nucleotidyltransferase
MRAYSDYRSPDLAAELLGLGRDPTEDRLRAFEAAGYLRQIDKKSAVGDLRWITTVQGNALAQASFGKPISRATAERHLVQVIERAATYNADRSYLLTVKEIAVFGSYLDPDMDRLGDLDLAVTVVRRETDGERHVDRVLEYARASGRSFGVFIEQLFWPSRELMMILKNRSPAISITREDIRELTDRFKTVYTVHDDPRAIQPPQDASIER